MALADPRRPKQQDIGTLSDPAVTGDAPGNIAVLRRRALDAVRRDTSKTSLSIKLKRAGWDDTFLRV